MRSGLVAVPFALAALMLGGCSRHDGSVAKGQVVATVDGQDITIHELNAEMMFSRPPLGMSAEQFRAAALQRIIDRRIIADIARDKGIDKTQNFNLQKRRAEDMLLVAMLQRQIVSRVGPPGRDDAQAYIDAHPDMFAQRKLFTVDQISFTAKTPAMLKDLAPIKTLNQLGQYLDSHGVHYTRAPATLDAARMDPAMLKQVLKLPAGEIFVFPLQGRLLASVITQTRVDPLIGEDAIRFALGLVRRERAQSIAKQQLDPLIEKARASVRYQKGYAPDAAISAGVTKS